MPKSVKATIKLNLLKSQSNPEKAVIALTRWLLSSGRYILVFVEFLVLAAFLARFKLDADLASIKEEIDNQIPYIQSLKPIEVAINNTQLKLTTISSLKKEAPDYAALLRSIADKTPGGVRLTNLSLNKDQAGVRIQIKGEAQTNVDMTALVNGLKQDPAFTEVTIAGADIEEGTINFTLTANSSPKGGRKL